MKKLAIMFVMLLGSVATMQAQSFDFSCSTITAEEAADQSATPGFDIFQDPLFEEAQTSALEEAGFLEGNQHVNGRDVADINHYAIHISTTAFVSIDVESDGYYVFATSSSPQYYYERTRFDTFEAALFQANTASQIINPADGFTSSEEAILSAAGFSNPGSGTWSRSNDDEVSADISKQGLGFIVYEDDYGTEISYTTLAEAITAANIVLDGYVEGDANSLIGIIRAWTIEEGASLQANSFDYGTTRGEATRGDVQLNVHSGGYTISTPGRTGASARSYTDIDLALAYAVSILSPAEVRRGQNTMIENAGFIADGRGDYSRARTVDQSGFNSPHITDAYGVTFRYFNNGTFSVNTRPNSLGKERTYPANQFDSALAYALSLETVSAAEDSRLTSAGIPRIQNAYANPILEIVYQVNLSLIGGEEFLKVAFNANNETILVIDGRIGEFNTAGVVHTFRRGNTAASRAAAFASALAKAKSIKNN